MKLVDSPVRLLPSSQFRGTCVGSSVQPYVGIDSDRLSRIFREVFVVLDGFEKGFNAVFNKDITQEEVDDLLGLDEDFRTKAINWLLQVIIYLYF